MEEISTFLKDYTAIIVAILAAAISIVNLVWSTRLIESRERRKILWEREMIRFFELEDTAGKLVEALLTHNIHSEEEKAEANQKIQALRVSTGSYLRYPSIAKALREVTHFIGWYIAKDKKHDTSEEYEKARKELTENFQLLVKAINTTLRDAPKRL
jgi:hypothetical protein